MKHFIPISFALLFSFFRVHAQLIDITKSQHKLTVTVADQMINGYLFLPDNITQSIDVIIAVHGSGGLVSDCADTNEIPEFKSQFRFWRDSIPKTGRAVFFIESFCERGVDSFQGMTPPEDEILSPYQIRAEDVKQSARLLESFTFVNGEENEVSLIDDQVWIGWSHGAGAVVAAAYEVPDNVSDLVFDVSSRGETYVYSKPLSDSYSNVKGIMAWYGGYNFFGYYKDGSDIFYRAIDDVNMAFHCGTNDNICFKDLNVDFIQKLTDDGTDITRYTYENVNHSFDNAKEDDSEEDQSARDQARARAFDFFDSMFKEEISEEEVLSVMEKGGIQVYPNPTRDYLIVKGLFGSTYRFELIDNSGKSVTRGDFTNSLSLNMKDFKEGLYTIKVYGMDSFESKRILIKK